MKLINYNVKLVLFILLSLSLAKQGQIDVLVATDVAARGLDIANVDLVLQTSPPMDFDTYVHRSGRTGRAGKEGTINVELHWDGQLCRWDEQWLYWDGQWLHSDDQWLYWDGHWLYWDWQWLHWLVYLDSFHTVSKSVVVFLRQTRHRCFCAADVSFISFDSKFLLMHTQGLLIYNLLYSSLLLLTLLLNHINHTDIPFLLFFFTSWILFINIFHPFNLSFRRLLSDALLSSRWEETSHVGELS